jgi:hypothetical protein
MFILFEILSNAFSKTIQKLRLKKKRKTMKITGSSGVGRTMFILPEMALFRPYYLEGKEAIPVEPRFDDMLKWQDWYKSMTEESLLVKQTAPLPGVKVVTHFTGLDYSREGKLFCTHLESDTEQCSIKAATWDEALQQHEEMILKAFEV